MPLVNMPTAQTSLEEAPEIASRLAVVGGGLMAPHCVPPSCRNRPSDPTTHPLVELETQIPVK